MKVVLEDPGLSPEEKTKRRIVDEDVVCFVTLENWRAAHIGMTREEKKKEEEKRRERRRRGAGREQRDTGEFIVHIHDCRTNFFLFCVGIGLLVQPLTMRERYKRLIPQIEFAQDYISTDAYNQGARTLAVKGVGMLILFFSLLFSLPALFSFLFFCSCFFLFVCCSSPNLQFTEGNRDQAGAQHTVITSSTRGRINAW